MFGPSTSRVQQDWVSGSGTLAALQWPYVVPSLKASHSGEDLLAPPSLTDLFNTGVEQPLPDDFADTDVPLDQTFHPSQNESGFIVIDPSRQEEVATSSAIQDRIVDLWLQSDTVEQEQSEIEYSLAEPIHLEEPQQPQTSQEKGVSVRKRSTDRPCGKGKRPCPKERANLLGTSLLTAPVSQRVAEYPCVQTASRVFALWLICMKILPLVRPDYMSPARWNLLRSTGFNYKIEIHPPEENRKHWCLEIDIPIDLDYLYRDLTVYGMKADRKKVSCLPKTHMRWWSCSKIFAPIVSTSNVDKNKTIQSFNRFITLPSEIIANEKFRNLSDDEKLRKIAFLCTLIITTMLPDQTLLRNLVVKGLGNSKLRIKNLIPPIPSLVQGLVEKVCQTLDRETEDRELRLYSLPVQYCIMEKKR